jgi:hypothetical protein
MALQQLTATAALFCNSEPVEPIPPSWLEPAIEFFMKHQLSPILFTASGDEFEYDDCYVFGDSGSDRMLFGEHIAARRNALVEALRRGLINSLGLDSPRVGALYRSDWRANVSLHPASGEFFVGADEELVSDPAVLFRWAFSVANGMFDVRYGFAYTMPLAKEPASYAHGSRPSYFAEFQKEMQQRREGIRPSLSPNDIWRHEIMHERRFLSGLFRGAYCANILSESHVRAADLLSRRIGKLSQLDQGHWLWELSDSELPQAEARLEAKNLLVSQAAPSERRATN